MRTGRRRGRAERRSPRPSPGSTSTPSHRPGCCSTAATSTSSRATRPGPRRDFTDAANRFDEAGITVERAKSRFNLGYVELLRGDLVAALRGMDDARDVLAPLSPAYRATVEQDRAEVLMAAGMSREAARALEAASSAYGAQRLRRFQADCELTLAQTLLRGDPARARVVARRAARRFRTQGGELPALQADGRRGGRRGRHRRPGVPRSVRRLDELAGALQARDDARHALPLRLQAIRLATALGDLDDAAERLRRTRVRDRDPLAVRLHWREVQAELAEARGRPWVARRHVRAGLTDLHAWQSSFGSLDLQSTLVGHGRDLARPRPALGDRGRAAGPGARVVRAGPRPGRPGGPGPAAARRGAGRGPHRAADAAGRAARAAVGRGPTP